MEIMSPDTGNRDPQTGTLIRLRGLYPSLKTALRKVADVILRQPEMAIYASVNEVAAVAAVSEATVMRFCRILGFKGFQDFKIALAREMVHPRPRASTKRWAAKVKTRPPSCAKYFRPNAWPCKIPWKSWRSRR